MPQSARVGVLNLRISNVSSVFNAVTHLGASARVVEGAFSPGEFSHLVLPGVGTFDAGMRALHGRLGDALTDAVARGVPLLGLCLGMHLLADEGEEGEPCAGLGLIGGKVRRLKPDAELRVPHMGWNEVTPCRRSRLFPDMGEHLRYYYMHSFGYVDLEPNTVAAVSDYGCEVVAAVEKGHVFGLQFHPEKSQLDGLRLLGRFLSIR